MILSNSFQKQSGASVVNKRFKNKDKDESQVIDKKRWAARQCGDEVDVGGVLYVHFLATVH